MTDELFEKLKNLLGDRVIKDEPMSRHTTFKVGGNADVFLSVNNSREAVEVIRLLYSNGENFFIIGNGSNLLVSDSGYRGIIVEFSQDFSKICLEDDVITADCGVLLSKLANFAYKNSLTGLEFASGIPGSLGGAVYMNAGAYGGEMKDVIESVTLYDIENDEIIEYKCDDMLFGYRTSILKQKKLAALSVKLKLKHGNADEIKAYMDELKEKRISKQPLDYPSAGSTFKRPEGYFAGKLIEDAGLKGYTVGGASVSEKHCGFVINKGGATADDVISLINDVKRIVNENSGVLLEPEVIIL